MRLTYNSKATPGATKITMSCPITLEPYTEENFPVSLPCGHSISNTAAADILARSFVFSDLGRLDLLGMRKFVCPSCRAETNVNPSPARHHFPKNYALLELILGDKSTATMPSTLPPVQPAPPARPVRAQRLVSAQPVPGPSEAPGDGSRAAQSDAMLVYVQHPLTATTGFCCPLAAAAWRQRQQTTTWTILELQITDD